MVAGVRSDLAPIGRPNRHYASMMRALDGSRLIDPTRIFDVLAPGTVRETGCFDGPGRTCRTVLDLHVAGTGFDTRRVANGNYLYCVGAVTIRNHAARRCVPVTVLN
jgi:hypothetical protein